MAYSELAPTVVNASPSCGRVYFAQPTETKSSTPLS